MHTHSPQPDDRTDVATAGTRDDAATALFELWYETRCRSLAELVRLQHLMLRAHERTTLGTAARDVGAYEGELETRLAWAALIGQLTLSVTPDAPQGLVDDQAVVLRLRTAWDLAARTAPPIWANESAEMPRLSRLAPGLALDPSFAALSPAAQVIVMQTAAWGANRAVLGSWALLAAGNNLHLPEARRAVAELEATGWAVCGAAAWGAPISDETSVVRISERASRLEWLCDASIATVDQALDKTF